MKIVTKKSDGSLVAVVDAVSVPVDLDECDVRDIPGWDWSLVDLKGVNFTKHDWPRKEIVWDGAKVALKEK